MSCENQRNSPLQYTSYTKKFAAVCKPQQSIRHKGKTILTLVLLVLMSTPSWFRWLTSFGSRRTGSAHRKGRRTWFPGKRTLLTVQNLRGACWSPLIFTISELYAQLGHHEHQARIDVHALPEGDLCIPRIIAFYCYIRWNIIFKFTNARVRDR